MASRVAEVEGTLQEDGTLILDAKPALPPGRVRVTLQPLVDLAKTPVWQTLERIWEEQQARGHVARSREEIDADIAAMREEDEQRMQGIERLHEECQQARRQGPSAGAS